MRRALIPFCLLASAGHLLAADVAKPDAPEIVRLGQLVGRWKGKIDLVEPDKPPQKLEFTMDCRRAAESWGVACETREWNQSLDIRESMLFGYDPNDRIVHFFSVDNQAETHDHAGRWTDERTLALEHVGSLDGRPFREKVSMAFRGKDGLDGEYVGLLDGKEIYRGKLQARK